MASSTASLKQVDMKLEMPELEANEEALAMEQGEEEDNSFVEADNGQMAQDGEQEQDKSIWRDLKQFVPVGDPAKMDEIKSLYGVSRAYNTGGRGNFIYIPCRSQRKYKCHYTIRWRRQDGMVQARGEHKHKKFYLPKTLLKGYKPNKCRECPFETNSASAMREHYGQVHPEKAFFRCAHCPAHYNWPGNLQRHVRRVHGKGKKRVKANKAIGRRMEEPEEDEAFLMAENGQIPEDGEQEQDKSVWRDLRQFLPVGDPAEMDEIKSLYGVSGERRMTPKRNFIHVACSSKRRYNCNYMVRWVKADGMVQARGEHNHKKYSLAQKPRQIHPEKKFFRCAHCPAHYKWPTNLQRHVRRVHGNVKPNALHGRAKKNVKPNALRVEKGNVEEEQAALLLADKEGMLPQMEDVKEEGQDKSVWRDLGEQFLPVGNSAKVEEIKSLYGVSGSYDSCRGEGNFIYMQCSSTKKYKCKYVIRWAKADGKVQAKGEHNHKKFCLPGKPRHTERQLEDEEEAEEDAEDNLDDLREIFATAIADELRKERQREAAAVAKAAALACTSGRVHQHLNNPPPLLNPVIGSSERADQNCWEPRYEGHNLAAQNDGHGNEWQYEGEESAEEVDQADHNGLCDSSRKHSGFQHIFGNYFL